MSVAVGPSQVYQTANGRGLLLFVREEERRGVNGYLLVGTRLGVVYTYWLPTTDPIPGELVNDTDGRAEAQLSLIEREQAERERDAMKTAMRQAVEWLSPTQADDLRKLYNKIIRKA